MENELKTPSRNFRSEKFVWSEFLAEWKTALKHRSSEILLFLHRWDYCLESEFDKDVEIENYYQHDGEQLGFHKKVHIKTEQDVLVIFILQETKNSNLFNKNCAQEDVKCHIQH